MSPFLNPNFDNQLFNSPNRKESHENNSNIHENFQTDEYPDCDQIIRKLSESQELPDHTTQMMRKLSQSVEKERISKINQSLELNESKSNNHEQKIEKDMQKDEWNLEKDANCKEEEDKELLEKMLNYLEI